MEKFKRKPRSKGEFLETIDDINGDLNNDKTLKKKPGRPALSDNIKTKKTSVSIRKKDEEIIDAIIDKLVSNGYKKPFPTSSEVHRMGIIALSELKLEKILKYYEVSKL